MEIAVTFQGPTGQIGTLGLQIVNPVASGPSLLLAPTTAGVFEVGTTGIYIWSGTVPDAEHYIAVWKLAGSYAGEGFTANAGSTFTTTTFAGDSGLAGTIGVRIVNADDGATDLLPHTTLGIYEIAYSSVPTGVYYWTGPVSSASHMVAIWDVSGSDAAEEIINPQPIDVQAIVQSGIDSDSLSEFWLKRNDTRDAITIRCIDQSYISDTNPTGVVDLTGAFAVFNMAPKADAAGNFPNIPTIHKNAVVVNAKAGLISYQWAFGDTNLVGTYDAEFEVHFGDGTLQTFPNTSWITVHIIPDIDPGL